jgi:hypothetical protein
MRETRFKDNRHEAEVGTEGSWCPCWALPTSAVAGRTLQHRTARAAKSSHWSDVSERSKPPTSEHFKSSHSLGVPGQILIVVVAELRLYLSPPELAS